MILDYPHKVNFNCNKSLRRFRYWLSHRVAKYISDIEYVEETNKFYQHPENRILGSDYREAVKNIGLVKHYHYAITLILNHGKDED